MFNTKFDVYIPFDKLEVIIKSLPVNCKSELSYVNPALAETPVDVPSDTKIAYCVGLLIDKLAPELPAVPEVPLEPDVPA